MAVWLAPALKAVLPHLGAIVSAVVPVFTRRKADAVANQMQLLQEQIGELQSAASQNAAHIKELATQLQSTVSALEQAGPIAEARIRRALRLAIAAFAVATIGLAAAAILLLTR
jgi:phage-related tail protein